MKYGFLVYGDVSPFMQCRTLFGGDKMLRGFSSLLGLFFVTAGVVAVASLTKTAAAQTLRPSTTAAEPRRLAMNTLAYHARPSIN